MSQIAIPCSLYRGGTSRGLLFLERDVPYAREARERMLLRMFGSPDARQIDGLGGGSSLTSKALFVGPSTRPDVDVCMTFAQTGVTIGTVDWGGNCGNMTAAVGPFAIESGLMPAVEPVTRVRILSLNTGLRVDAYVPVRGGLVETDGEYVIPGVPGCGARIDLEWLRPVGTISGRLLPTGQPIDRVVLADGRTIEASIVDAANPVVFCDAGAVGLRGCEGPDEIDARPEVLQTLEEIRSIAAERLAIVPSRDMATTRSPGLPKVAMVAVPVSYRTSDGRFVTVDDHDLQARLLSMQVAHRSYAGGAAIATAAASLVAGTIVHAVCSRPLTPDRSLVRIGHPYGVMDVSIEARVEGGEVQILSARFGRTARRIMQGVAYVPASIMGEQSRTHELETGSSS